MLSHRSISHSHNDINPIVIRTNQLLLGLILPLLLIAVGLIGIGNGTGLTAM